jgi:hypothetical protein
MPPAFATAPAREDRLIPTPMPPWITGLFAVSLPITSGFNSMALFAIFMSS